MNTKIVYKKKENIEIMTQLYMRSYTQTHEEEEEKKLFYKKSM